MNDHVQHGGTIVTILGSGTCVPSLTRSSCSVLIDTGDFKILLDSGQGTIRRLLEAGTSIFDISAICYSHLHPDHTGELVSFLFSTKYPDAAKRKKRLTLVGGRGFLTFYNGLKDVYGAWIELSPDLITIEELDITGRDACELDCFSIESIPVQHAAESIAYKITDTNGITIVYSGDTDYSENLVELANNADLFICESALPDNLKVNGHLTPSIAGEIAAKANVHKLLLTHFYPECDKVDIEKECRKTYSGKLLLAEDLMTITLTG